MARWTSMARPVLEQEQEDAELNRINLGSDASDGDRPGPRHRWTVPALVLGAAFGFTALAAATYVFTPWTAFAGQSQGGSMADAHVKVITDDELEAPDSRGSPATRGASAGPALLHVTDLSTLENKATAGAASCQIPCGGGDGTCSSALAGLLDGTTDSMPPGSDPSCGNAQELVKQQCPLCNCCGDMCAVSVAGAPSQPCSNPYSVPITLRDLNSSHPDMEQDFIAGLCKGLVEPVLAPDFTPVLSSNTGGMSDKCKKAITSASTFNDWYHDTAKNFPVAGTLTLCEDANGFFVYDDTAYFPLDGKAWDERLPGMPDHNYHMTMHFNNYFNMQGGEVFTFRGDDDVWVFFSKCDADGSNCEPSKLGIDLGGVHSPAEQTVDLANDLGFNVGDHIRMDFFWAERHTVYSNLRIVTNIIFDTETTTTSRTSTSRTTTSRTSTSRTTTSGTTTSNTETKTTVTQTVTTTTATTTSATTTTATTATTTSATTTATTTTAPAVPTTSVPPNPCEDGCDGKTCALKLEEIINGSGEGSSPPITLPEAVVVLLKMCPNCASCDPSGICPQIVL